MLPRVMILASAFQASEALDQQVECIRQFEGLKLHNEMGLFQIICSQAIRLVLHQYKVAVPVQMFACSDALFIADR